MSATPSEPSSQPQKNGEAERVRYIEELAGPEDAWVSITDAARITRSSEAMARRWITSGRLPIKRQPVGLNQHTRLVRLSDLATIRPIIDPAAGITDEIRRVDLPSIPRQQAQIMQDHQQLLQQVQEGQHVVSELRTSLLELATKQQQEVSLLGQQISLQQDEWRGTDQRLQQQQERLAVQIREQAQHIIESKDQLAEQERQHQQDLEQLRAVLLNQLQAVRAETELRFDHFDQTLRDQNNQMRGDLTTRLQQQEERIQHRLREMEDRQEQERKQIRAELQEALAAHRQALTTLVEQQLSDHRRDLIVCMNRLEETEQRLEQVAAQTETASGQMRGYHQRADTQEQALETLRKRLQDETEARQVLSERLATQGEHVQMLSREIEGLKQRKTEPNYE